MPGPWEKYQKQPEQAAVKPWEKYQAKSSAAPKDKGQKEDIFAGLPSETIESIKSQSMNTLNARGRSRSNPVLNESKASKLANLERLRQENPYLAKQIEETGGLEAFLVGAGEGFTSLARGVGLADQADDTEKKAMGALRDYNSAATAGKITAQAAPFLIPGGAATNIASTPLRVGAMGLTGASEGGIIARGEGGDFEKVAKGAGAGLLLGAGSEILLPVINSMGRQLIKRRKGIDAEPLTPDGNPTPELREALDDSNVTFDDLINEAAERPGDPIANARREKAFRDLGVTPTEAQRTRDTDLFVTQQDQYRKTGRVKQELERQEEILDIRARQEQNETGGIAERAGASPIEAIESKALYLDDEINKLYKQAREVAPEAKNVKFNRASNILRENAPSNEVSGGAVKALRDKMRSMGVIDNKFKPVGRVSVEQAEELRKYANRISTSVTGEGRFIVREFKNALDDDVFSIAGDDVFDQARKAKRQFETDLDPAKKNKFDRRKVSLVRDLRDNMITEDDLVNKVIRRGSKYKAQDVRELRDYLISGTPDQVRQGQIAWNDLRASALDRIREKAFKGPETQAGTRTLSRAGMESALREMGEEKFKVLFSPKEQDFIQKLARISALKEPPPGTFTGSGPSSPAIQKLEQMADARFGVIAGLLRSMKDNLSNRVSEKRVLNLVDDAEKIQKENARRAFIELRRSKTGSALTAIPAAATASASSD